jgi:uncharacterized protein YihD (DUF1040 family)
MSYFSVFPTTLNPDGSLLTDITIRNKIRDTWLNNNRIFYTYNYQDHDRPEDIADKYYGDQSLGWLVILSNNILDPNFDFPLSTTQFEGYLNDKYYAQGQENDQSGIEYAMSTIDPIYGYQKQITYQYPYNTVTEYYPVDQNTYSQIVSFTQTVQDPITNETFQYSLSQRIPLVTIYDTEFQNNENKRTIKILKKQYVNQAKTELLKLVNK